MEEQFNQQFSVNSDKDLLSLVKNPRNLDKNRLTEIIDELRNRGYSEQVDKIVSDLKKSQPVYSKFWDRVAALLIDSIVLGIVGFGLGLFFSDYFIQMGSQSILVGFIISIFYFGLGNSTVFNGQTIGKKTIKLQVVDNNKHLLSVKKSVIRALIYTVPYFLLNYKLDSWFDQSIFYVAKGIILVSFSITLIIHFILNAPTRQAIHDLIMKSYVIRLESYPGQELEKSRVLFSYIAGTVATVLIGFLIYINIWTNNTQSYLSDLIRIKNQIDTMDEVGNSGISKHSQMMLKLFSDKTANKSESIILNINLKKNLISNDTTSDYEYINLVKNAVKIILKNYPTINNIDFIQVNLIYGYNIGIFKSSISSTNTNSVENWKQQVK